MSAQTVRGTDTRPDWVIYSLLGMSLFFLPWARAGLTLSWGLLAAVLAWRWLWGETRPPRELLFGMAAWLLTFAMSAGSSRDLPATGRDLLGWVGVFLPVLAIASRRDRGGDLPGAIQAVWLASSLGLGLYMFYELVSGHRILMGPFEFLDFPSLRNPRAASQYTILLFGWTFTGLAMAREPAQRRWWTLAWVVSILIFAAGVTRAGWPAYLVMTMFISRRTRKPILGWVAVGLHLACNWVLPHTLWQSARSLADVNSENILGRIQGWTAALRMFSERAFTGQGLGAWKRAYLLYRSPNFPATWPHAHNFYLQTLAETGLLGLCGVVVFFLGFRSVWRAGFRSEQPSQAELTMTAALMGVALMGLFDMTLGGEQGYAFLALTALAYRGGGSLTPCSPD